MAVQGIWGGRSAALWSGLHSWAQTSCQLGRSNGPFAKVFLKQLDHVWHGDPEDMQSFRNDLMQALSGDKACAFTRVLEIASSQHGYHSKLWLSEQAGAATNSSGRR